MTLTGRDLRQAFELPFDDPDWRRKWFIGSAVLLLGTLVPVLPSLLFQGYLVRVIRSRLRGNEAALPEWGNWGEALFDGLRVWLVGILYRLPAYLVFVIGLGSMAGIPFVIETWAERGPSTEPFWVALPFLEWGGFALAMLAAALLAAAAGFVLPAAITHAIAREDLGAAFRPSEWWPIFRARVWSYVLIAVAMAACSLAVRLLAQAVSVTLILCCLVPLIVSPLRMYFGVVSSLLYARAYGEGTA